MRAKYRVASFFTGIGGMDLGALGGFSFLGKHYPSTGIEISFATDFDSKAAELYKANFSHDIHVGDIRDLDEELVPDHEIMTGGFPCQSFSVAATNPPRLGYSDLRGQLFFEMVRILKAKTPPVFVAENVKGLLSANGKKAFPLVLKEFEEAGYHVKWKILNAAHYGVPQKRERVFLVGFRDRNAFDSFEFPAPSVNSPVPISQIIEDGVDSSYFFSEKAIQGMKSTKNSVAMNKGRAQSLDAPSNTVGAHLAKVSLNSTDPVFLDEGRYRMFTPREVARIQSFPDSYELVASRSVQYRGLGNAVAPVLMWHIILNILSALESQNENISPFDSMPTVD